jgi:CBS domain-containing protein
MAEAAHRNWLKGLKLCDVMPVKFREVITLDKDATVEMALMTMREHNIISLPLVDKKKNDSIVGILNMTDLCIGIAFQDCFTKFKREPKKLAELRKPDFEKLIKTDLFTMPAEKLLGVSTEGKRVWEYPEDTSFDTIMEIFSKGVHRTIVKGKDGRRRIFTQWDMIKFFKENTERMGKVMETQIRGLGLLQERKEDLVTMTIHESALVGFQRLYNMGWEVHALPVLDRNGDLVATLSSSDLRGLTKDNFSLLLLPVLDFLSSVSSIHPLITARPLSQLGEVLYKVVYGHVHRIWIADRGTITGVISLGDVISKMSPFDFKQEMRVE